MDMMQSPQNRRQQRGMALVIVAALILVLSVVATGYAALTTNDLKAAYENEQQMVCYFLAEAGIDYAIYLIKHNMAVYPTSVYDADGDGSSNAKGSLINLNLGQEFVVISDTAYNANWLSGGRTGSFRISQSTDSTGNPRNITITSIGYIKNSSGSVEAQRTLNARIMVDTVNIPTATSYTRIVRFYEKFR